MGALITAVGAWFSTFVASLITGLSKKAFIYAYLASYVILTVAFMSSVNGVLSSLVASATPGGFVQAGLSLIPSNAPACVAAIGTAHLARWVFIWKSKFIKSWMVD